MIFMANKGPLLRLTAPPNFPSAILHTTTNEIKIKKNCNINKTKQW